MQYENKQVIDFIETYYIYDQIKLRRTFIRTDPDLIGANYTGFLVNIYLLSFFLFHLPNGLCDKRIGTTRVEKIARRSQLHHRTARYSCQIRTMIHVFRAMIIF